MTKTKQIPEWDNAVQPLDRGIFLTPNAYMFGCPTNGTIAPIFRNPSPEVRNRILINAMEPSLIASDIDSAMRKFYGDSKISNHQSEPAIDLGSWNDANPSMGIPLGNVYKSKHRKLTISTDGLLGWIGSLLVCAFVTATLTTEAPNWLLAGINVAGSALLVYLAIKTKSKQFIVVNGYIVLIGIFIITKELIIT